MPVIAGKCEDERQGERVLQVARKVDGARYSRIRPREITLKPTDPDELDESNRGGILTELKAMPRRASPRRTRPSKQVETAARLVELRPGRSAKFPSPDAPRSGGRRSASPPPVARSSWTARSRQDGWPAPSRTSTVQTAPEPAGARRPTSEHRSWARVQAASTSEDAYPLAATSAVPRVICTSSSLSALAGVSGSSAIGPNALRKCAAASTWALRRSERCPPCSQRCAARSGCLPCA